jgi:hypothetical protein
MKNNDGRSLILCNDLALLLNCKGIKLDENK